MSRWGRGLRILLRLVPFALAFARDRRRWLIVGRPAVRSTGHHAARAERLTLAIAGLGPTFIKLAQLFSARADILPEPYLSAISRLQDQVPPDPYPAIVAVLEGELGRPLGELFDSFEPEPVAAASLGQVHRAILAGEPVAVKVLRPGVEAVIALDLEISFRLLLILNVLIPTHHVQALTNVVREFSARVREEMDFRTEAAHIALFQKYFERDRRVRAPRVHGQFTRQRVIVMEWVTGDKVDRLAPRFAAGELDFRKLMESLTEVYLRMLLVEGFLHADPHPGNILVQQDGIIVFLDWGMVVQLSRSTRDAMLRLALSAGREDLDGMINGMYELGMIDPQISRSEIRDAAAEILAVIERVRDLGVKRAQEMIRELMDTFYTWPLMLPRELVYFFRAAALLEGIGYRYDPVFNGLEIARPVIRRLKYELIEATAQRPRQLALNALEEIRTGINALRDVITRAEREELRVRVHPRDVLQIERFLLLQTRRMLLSIFALTISLITTITFLELHNFWLLVGGLVVAVVMFLVVLFLPTHLLENPLRHARALRSDE